MSHYRVSYFKNLLSSDGHQFKCLQQQFDLPNADNAEEAAETAVRQFENLQLRHSLKMIADVIQVERVEDEQATELTAISLRQLPN
jgi:hypothetical protein